MNAHRMALVLTVSVGALPTLAATTQDVADPGVQLQAAIAAEEADGDLEAAIDLYRRVVETAGQDRALAARALLRLGGCHEKLGREEAARVYRRLVDDYPDQTEQVAAARRRLATLAKASAATTPGPRFRKLVIPSKPRYRSGGMLSPDGTRIAFLAEGAVWTVPVSGQVHPDIAGEPMRLTPGMRAWDNGNRTLGWSPDGERISFHTDPKNSVYVVPAGGGSPTLVLEGGVGPRAAISRDGQSIWFTKYGDDGWRVFSASVEGGSETPFTAGPANDPAVSPDGRYVAYVARSPEAPQGPWGRVEVLPAGGGTPILISETDAPTFSPSWSPDGRALAFAVWPGSDYDHPGRHEVWVVPLTRKRRPAKEATKIDLNEVTAAARYGKPAQKYTVLGGWSARGEIAVFTEVPFEQAIYTVSASGGRATRVALEGREPRWSPGGDRIYFRGHDGIEHVPPEGGESRLVVIRSKEELIVSFPMGSNAVSPDGERIVFAGFWRSGGGGGLFTIPIEGGAPAPLVEGEGGAHRNPCWSPDGHWVAFTGAEEPGRRDIFIVPSAGGTSKRLTSDPDRVADSELAWAPDGNWIAYFGEDQTIRLISPNGGSSHVLVRDGSISPDSAVFNGLSWSPDGSELAYAIPPMGSTIKVVPATGGEPRTLDTGFSGFVSQVAWSPDGQTFAFTGVTGGDEEIWLMSHFLPQVKGTARR
jgi:Tol biopolymer transport system component